MDSIFDSAAHYARLANPLYDTLVYYAKPPHSYIGAAIFLSYIVLALYATIRICVSLYTQYARAYHNTSKDSAALTFAKDARARHVKIYAFLASVSFAALAYHMAMFLVVHYFEYVGATKRSFEDVDVERIGTWMLDSTLFQDFANELVKDKMSATWCQLAVLGTWFWNIWMARKGTFTPPLHLLALILMIIITAVTRKFDAKTMQNFILLSQILPISFTICLFLIQLHLASPDIQPTSTEEKPAKTTTPIRRKPIASLHLPNILLNAALLALPPLRTHPIFSSLLVLARFILLLPHTGLISLRETDVDKTLMASAGFIVASQMMGEKKGLKLGAQAKALYDGGFAVRALGWDAVLSGVVWLCLTWGGGV
jgi:hypothetical protein